MFVWPRPPTLADTQVKEPIGVHHKSPAVLSLAVCFGWGTRSNLGGISFQMLYENGYYTQVRHTQVDEFEFTFNSPEYIDDQK